MSEHVAAPAMSSKSAAAQAHVLAAQMVQPAKERSYTRMALQPGACVLDVGCGPATDTIPLARLVSENGFVAGVDADKEMILAAERRTHAAGLTPRVRHFHIDALDLPFAPQTFDATRSERTFQHLSDPAAALAEMVRVTRPGGRVVVLDTDWATASLDTPYPRVERTLVRITAERLLRNGYAGRTLYRLFREQGLGHVTIDLLPFVVHSWRVVRLLARLDEAEPVAVAEGLLSQNEIVACNAAAQAADEAGCFYATVMLVLAAGIV
jgi:ubiquinone/menaquinone biosynthesis C-methylase UbiE